MKAREVIKILQLSVITGFITGAAISFRTITANQYISYKMLNIITLTAQRSLNKTIAVHFAALSLLYVFWILAVKKGNSNKGKIASLIVILALGGLFRVDRFFGSFAGAAAAIISILIFYWLLTKLKWARILETIKIKYQQKRLFLWIPVVILIICVLFLNTGFIKKQPASTQGRPNVILNIVYTLRADHVSCYGYQRKTTPNIDKLSQDSVLFKNAVASAPWTSPSAGTIFTSQYPAVLGYRSKPVRFDDSFVTFPEIFQENKYVTQGIISHDYISSKLGFNQGFDSFDEENSKGAYHISSPSITQKAISFLRDHKDDNFLLFLHYFDPHNHYLLHKEYDYYPDYDGPLYSGQTIQDLRKEAPNMSANDVEYIKALYDSEISFTDEYIGKFLDNLKELGLYEDSLIILTADHGEEFFERGNYWIGHSRTLYQELIHVPLIIKLPGSREKRVINEYVGLIDLMPTIVDIAGLKIPAKYDYMGKTIDINAPEKLKSRKIISETYKHVVLQSVLWDNWKLIYDTKGNTKELYDLTNDIGESENIALTNDSKIAEAESLLQGWYDYLKLKKSKFTKEAQTPNFTEEEKQRLKSLGYL